MHRKIGSNVSNNTNTSANNLENFNNENIPKFSSKYMKKNLYYIPVAVLTLCFLLILSISIFFRYTYLWEYTTLADNLRPIQRTTCELPQVAYNSTLKTNDIRFDWQYYLQMSPDLPNAGIKDKKQAWSHFKNFGKNEGRKYVFSNKTSDGPLNIGIIMMYESTDNM